MSLKVAIRRIVRRTSFVRWQSTSSYNDDSDKFLHGVPSQLYWQRAQRVAIVKEYQAKIAKDHEAAWMYTIDKAMRNAIEKGEWSVCIHSRTLAEYWGRVEQAGVKPSHALWPRSLPDVIDGIAARLAKREIQLWQEGNWVYIEFGPDAEERIAKEKSIARRRKNWMFGTLAAMCATWCLAE